MRRLSVTLSLLAALACAAYFVAVASATPPVHSRYSFSGSSVVPAGDLCSFDVTVDVVVGEVVETDFYDDAGNLTGFQLHVTEQDAFSANGKTLVSQVYHATIVFSYDENGDLTKSVAGGVLIKIPLPDGSLFIGAGRVDSFGGLAFSPDHGTFKNLDGLCAALSP